MYYFLYIKIELIVILLLIIYYCLFTQWFYIAMTRVDLLLLLLAMLYGLYEQTLTAPTAITATILVVDVVQWLLHRHASKCCMSYGTLAVIILAFLHTCVTQTLVAGATVIASFLIMEVMLRLFMPRRVITLSIPYTSSTHADTKAYAHHIANLILHYQQQGKRVVIRLVGRRGAGKSAVVSEVLRFLTGNPTATDFGTITFIGVKEYTVDINGTPINVVHIDPDVKGHQRLFTMHTPNWNVLLLEHGTSPAFHDHNQIIKKLGDDVVDITVDISQNDKTGERIFTMTSATGKPIETPPTLKWKGLLVEKRFSPDIRLTQEQVIEILHKCGKKMLVVLSIESSCDDTCITIRFGNTIIYTMQTQCLQSGQQEGKGGIDPFETAKMHDCNFDKALNEIRAKLQEYDVKIDLVSVTQGPGQAFALLEGISFAQKIAIEFGVPIMYLDHIKGHAISPLLSSPEDVPKYPYLVFVASGGHTVLLLVTSPVDMQIVYTTPDDAIGEVIDKIGRAMGILAIPAGPVAEERMNKFLGGKKELWTNLTSKTMDKEIVLLSSNHEEQVQLKEFRDALKELEKCKTPSQIKSMLNAMIMDQKLRQYVKFDLLSKFVRDNNLVPAEKDVKGWCSLFKKAWDIKKDGKASDVLERLYKDMPPVQSQSPTPAPVPTPSFAKFLDDYQAKTALPLEKQQFYCALLHSVLLSYLGNHFQDAIAKFPYVMHLSMAGGVACNVFLKEGLKGLLERDGRCFTVVPRAYCADNAHMMWKLTMETLRHLFETECICEKMRVILLQHGCGMLNTEVDKSEVLQLCGNRWDKSAFHKMHTKYASQNI
jgi:glycoprotease/Kae1 family metallohydrolase